MILTALAGCRSPSARPAPVRTGNASFEVLDDPPLAPNAPGREAEVQTSRDEIVAIAAYIHAPQAEPVYPPAALAGKGGTYVLHVTATFDETGRLVELHPSYGRIALPHPFADAFFSAAQTAVAQWRVDPARNVYWRVPDGGGEQQYLRTETLSTILEIRFTFDESGQVH